MGLGQAQHATHRGAGRRAGAAQLAARQPGGPRGDRLRAAVRDQAGDQGALLLRDEGEGVARGHARGAARAGRARLGHRGPGRDDRPGADPGRRAPAVRVLRVLRTTAGRSRRMVARRRRQHPPDFGRASTFVETLEEPEARGALRAHALRKIGYDGLVELEFKRDPRDGSFKLLDFNARTWGYHSLGSGGRGRLPVPLLPARARAAGRAAARHAGRPLGAAAHRPADRLRADPRRRLHASRVPAHAAQRARRGRLQPRGSASRPRRGRTAALSHASNGGSRT